MKVNIKKIGISIVLMFSFLATFAYDFEADGLYYRVISTSDFTCAVVDGEIGNVFSGENLYEGNIVIPSHVEYLNKTLTVTAIDGYAFYKCINLQSVILPETLKSIKTSAFEGCGISTIHIPNSVTEIGSSAFKNCRNLESISLPQDLKILSSSLFSNCTSLKTIKIPDTIIEIGSSCFKDCLGLTSIIFPDGLESIGGYAFENCENINSITFPNNLTLIGDYAFSGLNMITELYLPCSLREIGSYAFYKCGELKECTIAASEEPILFHKVRLKDVCGTFYGCTALSKLVLGRRPQIYDTYFNTLRAIRTSWIFNESITSISIMNNVDFWELISEKCFNESLEDLTLGTYDFANQLRLYDYSKLKYLTLSSPVPQKCPWFSDNQYMNIILKVPNGTIDTYKIADGRASGILKKWIFQVE